MPMRLTKFYHYLVGRVENIFAVNMPENYA